VKNTFIDVPSAMSPTNCQLCNQSAPIMTAPADFSKSNGFLQKALVTSVVCGQAPISPTPVGTPTRMVPHSSQTPLATPSPTAGAMTAFRQWCANPSSILSGNSVSTAATSQPGSGTSVTAPSATGLSFTTLAFQSAHQSGAIHSTPDYTVAPAPMVAPALQVAPTLQSSPGPQMTYTTWPMSPRAATCSVKSSGMTVATSSFVNMEGEDDDDEDSDDAALLPAHLRSPVDAPRPPPGALHPSMGSEAHAQGTCKRCCFFPRGRCTNGYTCEFCHYEHEKRKRKNKKKKKKDGYAVQVSQIQQHLQVATGQQRGGLQQMSFPGVSGSLRQMATVVEESPRQLLAAATPREPMACQAVGTAVLDDRHHQRVILPSYSPGQLMPGVLGRIIYGPTQGYAPPCPQQLSPQQLQPQMQPPQVPQLPPQQIQPTQLQQPMQSQALEMAPPPIQSPRLPQVVMAAPPMTSSVPLVPPPMNSPKISRTLQALSPWCQQQQACAAHGQWGGAMMFQMAPQTSHE